ncbi:MAG: hypothetical protein WAW17_29600 [Rhodococcus sp. (in: high G+C Gram-positive bacteria)]|uniref:hypothetical protein n=1 Tax=Rhodococcus sp. TaxID=1831 RepID=UPI003BB1949C
MSERFDADASQIAGLAESFDEIGADSRRIADFVGKNGPPSADFSGAIISSLLTPFVVLSDATTTRMADIAKQNVETGVELNKAAWMYHDQETKNYDALNAHTRYVGDGTVEYGSYAEMPGITAAYDSPVSFPKPEEVKLDDPVANKEDVGAIVTEAAGWLGEVNESIKNVTRIAGKEWNPLEYVLSPISGNWSELKRIGETYKIAGNAFEASARNIDDGLNRVGEYWDGKAALAFDDYARLQSTAMKWEGPVGRILALALEMVADKIRDAVRTAVEKLADLLEAEVSLDGVFGKLKFLVKKVPVIGTSAQIASIAHTIYKVADLVMTLVREIEELTNRLKEYLEFLSDPALKAKEKLDERLSPITSRVDDATRRTAIAKDMVEVGQADKTLNRPKHGYEVGQGTQPWEDA